MQEKVNFTTCIPNSYLENNNLFERPKMDAVPCLSQLFKWLTLSSMKRKSSINTIFETWRKNV